MIRPYEFSLGELIYTIRKLNKLTQVDYSKKLGVVQSTISKVEKNIFEDIPFNLISKISLDFKVPLQYFQGGILPFKKTKNVSSIIAPKYLNEGFLQAKTIYYLLISFSELYGDKLYKIIGLPYQYLSLCNIMYGPGLIEKLYVLDKEKLEITLNKLCHQLKNIKLDSMNHDLPQYYESLKDFKFIYQEQDKIIINGNKWNKDILPILLKCIELELLINLKPDENFDLFLNEENKTICLRVKS